VDTDQDAELLSLYLWLEALSGDAHRYIFDVREVNLSAAVDRVRGKPAQLVFSPLPLVKNDLNGISVLTHDLNVRILVCHVSFPLTVIEASQALIT
tara:strand:- start:34 stop:321 length:288 start_codon:yes stop_codon:yes gene_type:complete